jgi:transposase
MPADRSFHLIEAFPAPFEGAPIARRRRWSDAFKAAMVAKSFEPGANVSALAREIGISASQLFGWRSIAVGKNSAERRIDELPTSGRSTIDVSRLVEVELDGARIRIGPDVEEAHLRRVLRAVRSA